MDIFFGVIVGLLVLMMLVTLHEFGHFLAARKNGVRVLEFGIGFPPRAKAWRWDAKAHKWRKIPKSEWDKSAVTKTVGFDGTDESEENLESAKKSKGTKVATKSRTQVTVKSKPKLIEDGLVFSLNWLPIGGFCQMDGESAVDKRPGTFGHAIFWSKTKILFAGVTMNWLTAFVILTILAWTGMPTFLDGQFTIASDTRVDKKPVEIARVMEGSPAELAGMTVGEKIIAADGAEVSLSSEITKYNEAHAGEEAIYTVLSADENCRENCTREVKVKLNDSDAEYLLGVSLQSSQALSYSTWSAPIVGAGLTLQITGETYRGLGEMLWNLISGIGSQFSFDGEIREEGREAISSVGDSVSGPVGIVGVLFPSFTAAGPTNLAFLAALISISLACMNVLPIPALDGGRWLLIAIYKIRGKELTKATEEKIVSRAFMVLLALLAIVTVLDITRFFG